MESPKSKASQSSQKELEIALNELEERLDRLRASYDQYFMGFEKIEPGVLRKDVDRRFSVLRKQQIRNTALRFRFNVLAQKMSTYTMYWARVCRQIEEGTYKRHLARAAKRFGTPGQSQRERDDLVEIELGELDEDDMNAVLAEADRAAAAYDQSAPETPAPNAHTVSTAAPGTSPLAVPTPATPFAASGRPSPEPPPGPPANGSPQRIARPAALPPGTKQPMLVRRRTEGDFATAGPDPVRPPMGSSPDAPSRSIIRATPGAVSAEESAPRVPVAAQAGPAVPAPQTAGSIASSAGAVTPQGSSRLQAYRPVALPPKGTRVALASASTPRTPGPAPSLNVSAGDRAASPDPARPSPRPGPPVPAQAKKDA